MQHFLINGVQTFSPQSRNELIDFAFENKSILVAVNAEKILHATDESRSIINRNVGYPDGIGAVWALKKKGALNPVKIPGCELWLDIIKKFENEKTFYLIGGKNDVIIDTVNKLKTEHPNIKIVNFRNGYFQSIEEKEKMIQDVIKHKPDVVFVAMGSPKQELLMEEIHQYHPVVYQGLGGSFDVYIGKTTRASKWWVNNNLEWAYRLINQPSRIKRQIYLVKFYILLKLNRF
jgi:UDP-N-acetyl-D-mannosaminouronate:lipid I N-acetyl-D-mannosaminouronosyltransferase